VNREELAQQLQAAFSEKVKGNAAVHVTPVQSVAPDDETGFGTFSVHVGGLDADIFHVHVYKE